MKKGIVVIASALVMCLAVATAFAASDKVNNTICPVMGDKIDMKDPVTVEYNGKIYNLCCSACVAMFKANPEKYSKIAEDQAKGANK